MIEHMLDLSLFLNLFHNIISNSIWMPPSQSELTLIISNMDLTHLGSEGSE